MRIAAIVVVVATAGCGRVDFDTLPDGSFDAPTCTLGSWTTPRPIPELSSPVADFGGQVTADGLGYYFQSRRSGTGQLYVSHRADRMSAWSPPAMIAELDDVAEQVEAAPTDGELAIYFTSTRPSGGPQCTWYADRTSPAAPFGNLVRLDALCAGGTEAIGPYPSLDGLTLYYSTNEGSSFGTIYESHRANRGDAFGLGAPVPGLETGPKGYPYVAPDALTVYYEAFGTGASHHLYVATRSDAASAFGPAIPIPGVDDDNDNEDVSLTADGLEMFIASGRAGTMGEKDIFTATRSCD